MLPAVDYSRSSSHPLLLRSYHLLSAVNLAFSFPFVSYTSVMGSKTHRRGVSTKGGGEWLGLGAHEEEDSKQQTKDEPSDRYKGNQQDNVAAGNK